MFTRLAWAVLLVVVVTILAVPALRELARPIPVSIVTGIWPAPEYVNIFSAARDANRFVERQYPGDTQMALAAAIIANSVARSSRSDISEDERHRARDIATTFLSRETQREDVPAVYATQVMLLFAQAGLPNRGSCLPVVGPTRADILRQREEVKQKNELPEQIRASLLKALHSWQQSDPQNGMPLLLEAQILYGMGLTDQALHLWRQAATSPVLDDRRQLCEEVTAILLRRMGFPVIEAWSASRRAVERLPIFLTEELERGAVAPIYEGYTSLLEGDIGDAQVWWDIPATLSRTLIDQARDSRGFDVGIRLQQIADIPTHYIPSEAVIFKNKTVGKNPQVEVRSQNFLRNAFSLQNREVWANWFLRELIALAGAIALLLLIHGLTPNRYRIQLYNNDVPIMEISIVTFFSPLLGRFIFIGLTILLFSISKVTKTTLYAYTPSLLWSLVVSIPLGALCMAALVGFVSGRLKRRVSHVPVVGLIHAAALPLSALLCVLWMGLVLIAVPKRAALSRDLARLQAAQITHFSSRHAVYAATDRP